MTEHIISLDIFDSQKAVKTAKALSSPTRNKILKILKDEPTDVSRIAEKLGQTEANISAQVKILQDVDLIECIYVPGEHGVRKICFIPGDPRMAKYKKYKG